MSEPVSKSTEDSKSTYDEKYSSPGTAEDHTSKDAVEPTGYRGDNPATGGPGRTGLQTPQTEEREGDWNPSSPEDGNITPGSKVEQEIE